MLARAASQTIAKERPAPTHRAPKMFGSMLFMVVSFP
jgi:hypothetical protein